MGLVAAIAVAVAAACATAAGGGVTVVGLHVSSPLFAVALVPGVVLAGLRPPPWARPRTKLHEAVFGIALLGSGVLVVTGFRAGPAGGPATAPAAAAAVVLMSLYWPDAVALGIATMAAFVYLVTGSHGAGGAAWVVASVAAGSVAVVATARLHGAQRGPRRASAPELRRTVKDAALLLAVAGLVGGAVAALIPSPPDPTGFAGRAPGRQPGGSSTLNPLAFDAGLDLGAARHGGDNEVVLHVAAPRPDAWRTATLDTWNGRSWHLSARPVEADDARGERDILVPPGPGETDTQGTGSRLVQRVTVETDSAQVLAAAAVPRRVVVAPGSYVFPYAGLLIGGPAIARHATYRVESSRFEADPAALTATGTGAVPAELADDVATRPTDDRIRALARQIAEAAPTNYDKARAVERWLTAHTVLNRTDAAVPRGQDVVAHVLFVDRAGRPERVATTMVVLLRTLGVPARLGVGFAPGERSSPASAFTVRASDATAWAEVWFPGAGWQRFDPSKTLEARRVPRSSSVWDRLGDLVGRLWLLVLVVALGAVALVLVAWRRHRQRQDAVPWATRFYARLSRAGNKARRPRLAHETPVEYTEALAQSVLPDPRLVEVGALVTSAAFSGRAPSPEEQEWAETVLQEATAAARRAPPPPAPAPSASGG